MNVGAAFIARGQVEEVGLTVKHVFSREMAVVHGQLATKGKHTRILLLVDNRNWAREEVVSVRKRRKEE